MKGRQRATDLSPRDVRRELRRRLKAQHGYDAFISHVHEPDARLAQRIEKRLEGWARPWYGGRAMRVFRDTSKMRASTGLRTAIQSALDDSGWLVLVLSPQAAGSDWLGEEVSHWRSTKGSDRILLVHVGGHLGWDDVTGDFSAESDCVPDVLRGAFTEMPRFVDLTGLGDDRWLERRRRMHTGIRDLATSIHDLDPDLLEGAHRSSVRIVRFGVGALTILLAAAAVLAGLAIRSGRQAEESARLADTEAARADEEQAVANANAAAARALDLHEDDIDIGLLLAVEAWTHRDTPETRAAIAAGLAEHRHLEQVVRMPESPHRLALSPDETKLAVFSLDQRLVVWDLDERREIADVFVPALAELMAFDPAGERLAVVTTGGALEVRHSPTFEPVGPSVALGATPNGIVFAGREVLVGRAHGVDAVDIATGSASLLIEAPVQGIAVDATGRHLALATENLVQVWDVSERPARGIEEAELERRIEAVGISPDGRVVAFATDQGVGRWDRPQGTLFTSHQTIPYVESVVPAEGGSGVVALQAGGTVAMWAPLAPDVVSIDVGGKAYATPPAVGARGRRVASLGDALAMVWRTERPFTHAYGLRAANLLGYQGEPMVRHLAFSPAGDRLLVIEPTGMAVVETAGWSLVAATQTDVPCAARFTADGTGVVAVVVPEAGGATLQTRSATQLDHVLTETAIDLDECPMAVDVDPNGESYAVYATVRRAGDGAEIASGSAAECMDNALSADGTQLAWSSAGSERTGPVVRELDLSSGAVTEHPTAQDVWGVAQGPGGTLAAGLSLGQDEGAVAVWDADFARTATFPRHHLGTREPAGEDPVTALAVDPQARRVAAGSMLGALTVWELDPGAMAGLACDLANRSLTAPEVEGGFSEAILGFEAKDPCAEMSGGDRMDALGPLAIPAGGPDPQATTAAPATTTTTTQPAATTTTSEPVTTTTARPRGDLGLAEPMTVPACDGGYVTLLGSVVDPDEYVSRVAALLEAYPGSRYLRTDVAGCSSLRQHVDGDAIYAIFFGPYPSQAEAVAACSAGPPDAYVKSLDDTSDPANALPCP